MSRASRNGALILALLASPLLFAGTSHAQAVLGPGADAVPPGRGVLRFSVTQEWHRWSDLYGPGGVRTPIGASLTHPALGTAQLEVLGPAEEAVRALSGVPGLTFDLGGVELAAEALMTRTPIAAELGVSRRLWIGVTVPIVRTITNPVLRVNPAATGGNVGFNPGLTTPAAATANEQLFGAFTSALTQLQGRITQCMADPAAAPDCPTVLAQGPALQSEFAPFATGVEQVYGGWALVPRAGTQADAGIRQRLIGFSERFRALDIAAIPNAAGTGPIAPVVPLTGTELQALLVAPEFGIGADPPLQILRRGIGDIEASATLLAIDGIGDRFAIGASGVRLAFTGAVRLGVAGPPDPDNPLTISLDDGQTDIELRAVTDVVLHDRAWLSVSGRYTHQRPDRQERRIAPPGMLYVGEWRRQEVGRDLGDEWQIDVSPRAVIGRYLAVGGTYSLRQRAPDRYTGTFDVTDYAGNDVTLDASILETGENVVEHRIGGGLVYSTLAAYAQGRARVPLEARYMHVRTVSGSGYVPRASSDIVQLRLFIPIFGR